MSLDSKHNSPLNSSSSKQLYSFPKSQRFPKNQLQQQLADVFYEHQAKREPKSFSFGKSKRLKTQSVANKNSSEHFFYNIEGQIQKTLRKKAGIKILYGRQECKSKGIFSLSETPGPGQYNPNPQATKFRISTECSIGHDERSKLVKQNGPPGPGAYKVAYSLSNEGKIMSNDTKKAYGKILFQPTKPSKTHTQKNPQIRKYLFYLGFPQINSKGQKTFQKGKGFLISKSRRFEQKNQAIEPGPGSYKVFSEFLQPTKR